MVFTDNIVSFEYMGRSIEQLEIQIKELFENQLYDEIIALLSDQKLEVCNDANLYAWKARAYGKIYQFDLSYKYAQKAIEINPMAPMGYLARGNAWANKKQYIAAIDDYDQAIAVDNRFSDSLINRGYCYYYLGQYANALADLTAAIALNEKRSDAYYKRGNIYYRLEKYQEALQDYNKAIAINDRESAVYHQRGNIWLIKKQYNKALNDYTRAIVLAPKSGETFVARGMAWQHKQKYKEAVNDFSKAIHIKNNYADAYYFRASVYKAAGNYSDALNDYERYVDLQKNDVNYSYDFALAQIRELKKIIENSWYEEIGKIVNGIKQLLLFENEHITHFTSLSATKSMVLDQSLFRLSEGNYLNDTSEGRELFKYLSFSTAHPTEETIAESFVERPFIGSFVSENKHDDLTLWRMYGKEAEAEAKGCALTINKERLIKNLEIRLSPYNLNPDATAKQGSKFIFYKVAYKEDKGFRIPGSTVKQEKKLNDLLFVLKNKVKQLNAEQGLSISKQLNDIAYLFKSSDYQYENEVRLVIQGLGFKKEILKELVPPRVYIELVPIVPVLCKITLGPKVERPDEWAAAFNYQIEEQLPPGEKRVEIVISHLPFK